MGNYKIVRRDQWEASFFSALGGGSSVSIAFDSIWNSKAPPRVVDFAWLAIFGAILTMDSLQKRNMIFVNG